MIISYKHRIASGSIALALAAGSVWAAPADQAVKNRSQKPYENIFLGEVAPVKYSELTSSTGVIGEVEVVRERYADGKIRVERQVTLNNDGNYVNHGAWKLFSTDGDVQAEGQYNFGQRNGMWTRWVGPKDTPMLAEFPFKQFKAPFMSQVNFVDGKMEGEWTITDANDRKVMMVALKGSERNGNATIWMPNGKVYRQLAYDHAVPVGELMEANTKTGEVSKTATYENGHKIITKTEHFPHSKQVKSEITYLAAKTAQKAPDDFWTTTLAKFSPEGKDLRHGPAKTWFANGQLEQEGAYHNDKKAGVFTYWHENGQVATTGEYRDDKPEGNWVWFYQNGQKSSVGTYEHGTLMGDWRWWDETGKLTKQQSYNGTESASSKPEERRDVSQAAATGTRL